MKLVKLSCFVLSVVLSACQSTESQSNKLISANTNLYHNELFPTANTIQIENEADIFTIDDEMKAMVAEKLRPERDVKKRALKLLRHIFETENIGVEYASNANVTAREAYHNKTANCMSLTIMAYALANEADLQVEFQSVKVPEYWVRNGDYNMLTGHVNLKITKPTIPGEVTVYGSKVLEIDFDPFVSKKSFPKKVIPKNTVLAMFYNNKGAGALVEQDFTKAYRYLTAATDMAPRYAAAWGNLGILYRFIGKHEYAKQTYRYAIELDRDNLTAMTNLSFLLKHEGKIEEAQEIERILHRKRIKNPYYHALLADEAFYKGDDKAAIKHYKKAIKLDKNVHEFYFGLAKIYYKQERLEAAKQAMLKAISINRSPSVESQYTAKLNFLKQKGSPH